MSAIDSISTSNPPSSSGGINGLTSQEFLKVMLTELSKQDPLAPNDTKEILQQIGTIRSIEANLQLSKDLTTLVNQNKTTSASGLVGAGVVGRTSGGEKVAGIVRSVSVTKNGPMLNLMNGFQVSIDRVEEIMSPTIESQIAGAASSPAPHP